MDRRPTPRAAALLALLAAAAPLLAGCSGPAQPEVVAGASDVAFAYRPYGALAGHDVLWTTRIVNQANATSAQASLVLSVSSSVTHRTTEQSAPVAPLPPHGSVEVQVRTPYDGLGDYSGTAELRVGARTVAQTVVFYEQCRC